MFNKLCDAVTNLITTKPNPPEYFYDGYEYVLHCSGCGQTKRYDKNQEYLCTECGKENTSKDKKIGRKKYNVIYWGDHAQYEFIKYEFKA